MPSRVLPNPVDKNVGARIRMRRLLLNMSQEKLGKAIGLTFQQIQKYEKGTNRVGGSRLHQIATALDVQPGYFFEGVPETSRKATQTSVLDDLGTTHDGIELAQSFLKIENKNIRRRIVELVTQIAASEQRGWQ